MTEVFPKVTLVTTAKQTGYARMNALTLELADRCHNLCNTLIAVFEAGLALARLANRDLAIYG